MYYQLFYKFYKEFVESVSQRSRSLILGCAKRILNETLIHLLNDLFMKDKEVGQEYRKEFLICLKRKKRRTEPTTYQITV